MKAEYRTDLRAGFIVQYRARMDGSSQSLGNNQHVQAVDDGWIRRVSRSKYQCGRRSHETIFRSSERKLTKGMPTGVLPFTRIVCYHNSARQYIFDCQRGGSNARQI